MRNVTVEDLYQFRWPNNPKFSPNGEQVVYEITKARKKEKDNETHLWVADVTGKSKRALTTKGTRNRGAVWSPDGKEVVYLSNQSHGVQVWIHSLENGKSRMITDFHYDPSAINYSPDGKTLYAQLPAKDNIQFWDNETSHLELTQSPSNRTYDTLYYKFDGIGFNNGKKKQIIAIDIETKESKLLTNEALNIEEITISPDGTTIAFATIDFEYDNPLFNGSLYQVSTIDGKVTKLFDEMKVVSPSYSPDGNWLAFISDDIHQDLYVIPASGGNPHCLSIDYPGTLSDMISTDSRNYKAALKPQWSKDGKYMLVLSGYHGTNELVRFALEENEEPITVVSGARTIIYFDYDGKNNVVVAYTAAGTPGRLSLMDVLSNTNVVRKPRELTEEIKKSIEFLPENEVYIDDCNSEIMSRVTVVEPKAFSYESVDGWKIHGFMIEPANREEGKKYPVVLDIHGGPHSTHGYTYFHQMQLYSAQGYAVVFVNPRGSSGYGEQFTKAVIGEYGTKDMEDIVSGLDKALEKYEFLDESRVAVAGLSYGGYMTNWLVTHSDRFQAAISEGGISNWISMHGTSDISPGFVEREFANKTSFDELWKASPLAYVKNINTPILIVHSEDDLRVPIEQSEQFYSFIKREEKEARFVRIPESTHLVLQNGAPDKKIARLQSMIDWLQLHV